MKKKFIPLIEKPKQKTIELTPMEQSIFNRLQSVRINAYNEETSFLALLIKAKGGSPENCENVVLENGVLTWNEKQVK